MKPATPLPWQRGEVCPVETNYGDEVVWTDDAEDADLDYIVAACNAYPKLVEALKLLSNANLHDGNCASLEVATRRIHNIVRPILHELGEIE